MEVRNVYSLRFIPASKHKDGTNNIYSHRLVQKLGFFATLGKLNEAPWSLARRRCKKLQSSTSTKSHVAYMVLTTKQFFIQWFVWLKLNLLVTVPKVESFPVIFESPSKPTILATILENVSLKGDTLYASIAFYEQKIGENAIFEKTLILMPNMLLMPESNW